MNMKISQGKRNEIIKQSGCFYHKTTYSGWLNTIKTKSRRIESEEILDIHISELGYNIFLSELEAENTLKKN